MTDEQPSFGALQVPALKAHMGDWIYYAAFLKLRDIAERVSIADEIHKHKGLRDMIQRTVDKSKHVESIRQYLLGRPQRFFNALVIGVYGGEPNFYELNLKQGAGLDPARLPEYFEGALGVLQFSGDEKLFAIDGQHRVVGIKRAVQGSESLGDEEVVALFVPHSRDTLGMERSRRLFTTLNRYAKPVSKMDIIALDEDDVVAIVTRMLVEDYPLFRQFLKIKKGKALYASDHESFTTIETLYDSLDSYLDHGEGWLAFKRARPSDAQIGQYYRRAVELWDGLSSAFPQISDLAGSKKGDQLASQFRGKHGGHLMFRPAGLMLVVDLVRRQLDHGRRLPDVLHNLALVPTDLSGRPWNGLLWDSANGRMITPPENRDVALRILYYGTGGDLRDLRTTPIDVRREWAGILNRQPREVSLRRWV